MRYVVVARDLSRRKAAAERTTNRGESRCNPICAMRASEDCKIRCCSFWGIAGALRPSILAAMQVEPIKSTRKGIRTSVPLADGKGREVSVSHWGPQSNPPNSRAG